MTKDDLIQALRDTGIVSKENDANGIRILVTHNDSETIEEQLTAARWRRRLELAQTIGIIVTTVCLIATTAWGIVKSKDESPHYISRGAYVVKIQGNSRCLLLESTIPDIVEFIKRNTGLPQCSPQ